MLATTAVGTGQICQFEPPSSPAARLNVMLEISLPGKIDPFVELDTFSPLLKQNSHLHVLSSCVTMTPNLADAIRLLDIYHTIEWAPKTFWRFTAGLTDDRSLACIQNPGTPFIQSSLDKG